LQEITASIAPWVAAGARRCFADPTLLLRCKPGDGRKGFAKAVRNDEVGRLATFDHHV
jgi:hypothetical protein